jgi:MFS family permease
MKREIFPLWQHRTVAMYYVLSAVYNAWFMAGVWAFIWGMFMTNSQIGVSDSMTFLLGFLIELPAGVIADTFGRKRTVIFGNIAMALGVWMIAFSTSFWGITLWYGLWTIGYGFQSGATEALVYDYLKAHKLNSEWPKVRATSSVIATVTYPICIAIGGILFGVYYNLPYIAAGVVGCVGIAAACLLRESRTFTKPEFSWKLYGARIRDGSSILFKKSIVPVALTAITVMSVQIIFTWGLLRPYTVERFGYSDVGVSHVLAVIAALTALILIVLGRFRKRFGTVKTLLFFAGLYGVVFTSFFAPYNWLIGAIALLVAAVSANYVEQLFSIFINVHAHEEHRATTLSTVALITRAPYALLAIVTGILADWNMLPLLCLVLGCVVMAVVGGSLLVRRAQPAKLRAN